MRIKVSEAVKRKLREAAKARWAKAIAERGGAVIPQVVTAIDVTALEEQAGAAVVSRGRAHAMEKQGLELESASDQSVTVRIKEGGNYLVTFELVDGETIGFCECGQDEDDQDEVICEHKIAAAVFLKDHYAAKRESVARPIARKSTSVKNGKNGVSSEQPVAHKSALVKNGKNDVSSEWKESLAKLLRQGRLAVQKTRPEGILFFSIIRRDAQFIIQPGVISADSIPPELWQDRMALSAYLLEHRQGLRSSIAALESHQLDFYHWVNAAPGHRALATHALQQLRWAYGYPEELHLEELANALVFRGNERELIREPLEVLPQTARIGLEMRNEAGDVHLSPIAALPDRTIKLKAAGLEIFRRAPLWLCKDRQVFQAGVDLSRFNLLKQQAEIVIPPEAVEEFYQFYFPQLVEAHEVHTDEVIETLAGVMPQPRVYLTDYDGELRVLLRFAYRGLDCTAVKNVPPQSYVRDAERNVLVKVERQVELEREWWQRLGTEEFNLKCGNSGGRTTPDVFLLRTKVHPFDFLKHSIPKLAAAGAEVFGEADLKIGRLNRARPTISFDISSGIDWFDLKAVIHFGDLEVSLNEIRKALRKEDRFIKLADGTIGEIPPEWLEKYKHLFGLSETAESGLRLARHHITLLNQLLVDNESVTVDQQFEVARAWIKNFEGIQPQPLPRDFQGELRLYQKAGFDWLHFLRESRFGGCLADDMGTGKTIQTLCFLQSIKEAAENRNNGRRRKKTSPTHLLIVPRSLVTNWEREAQKFTPNLKLINFAQADRLTDLQEFGQYDVVLTTYGILLREIERLKEYEFDTVILDEAQAIKNPVSESAKAARRLKSRHRLTLTGTPVENNTLELWSQFAFLNPGLLGSIDYFREEFSSPIERQNDQQATTTLRRLVYPFILRRTKDQVALDLPPRSEKILWGEMEPEQRRIYDRTRDEYRAKILKLIEDKGVKDARFRILEGLLRLRQICNDPRLVYPSYQGGSAKLDTLLETLETLRAEGHKALIFSQFVQMLKLIEKELKRMGIEYSYLDGSTVNRQARVDAFQSNDRIQVFLISLKAGGVGLNLTAADYVIHVDPWWNPAVEMQASDRAHRIGQDKPVFVYKLTMRDSVEEKILQLQERKRSLVQQLVTTEAGFFKSLTADDIAALFS